MRIHCPYIQSHMLPGSDAIAITCHERELPAFVETELIRLYGNFYSSLAFLKTFRALSDACAYVASKDGQVITLLLFRKEPTRILVLNELLEVPPEEVRRFADYIFGRFAQAQVISFPAIHTTIDGLPYPCQLYNEKEDYVIALPSTEQEYTGSLGKHTRHNLRRYSSRLADSHPSFSHRFYENEDIAEQYFRDIVALSRKRMDQKKKTFGIGEEMLEGFLRLSKTCGLMNVALIDNRVCAGSICFRSGAEYFGIVNAFDPEYDNFFLGIICYYQTICECILRGATRFHMAWDRYDYKSRLLGVRQDFDRLVIYRSRLHQAINLKTAIATLVPARKRQLKLWLDDPGRRNSLFSKLAFQSLHALRSLRGNGG